MPKKGSGKDKEFSPTVAVEFEFSEEDLEIIAEYVKALVDIDLLMQEGASNAGD